MRPARRVLSQGHAQAPFPERAERSRVQTRQAGRWARLVGAGLSVLVRRKEMRFVGEGVMGGSSAPVLLVWVVVGVNLRCMALVFLALLGGFLFLFLVLGLRGRGAVLRVRRGRDLLLRRT